MARRELTALRPTRSMSDDVAAILRRAILRLEFEPGERLVESALASELQISRAPVREALLKLAAEGLVIEEPRRGYRVIKLDHREVREIYELRSAIEGLAAELLQQSRSKAATSELRRILEQAADAGTRGDNRRVTELDFAFHEALCRLSGNRRLHAVFRTLAPALQTLFNLDEAVFGPPAVTISEHLPIVEAIERGDPSARQLVADHMTNAERQLSHYLRRREKPSGPRLRLTGDGSRDRDDDDPGVTRP
jgi:DNA-binding GntR family transcriptional regulator